MIDLAFSLQSLDDELKQLPAAYGPPRGRVLLAELDGASCGAVAYRRLSADVCEMKRLYVSARAHGRGLGRRLCEALFDQARQDGYRLMRLDTASAFSEAIGLYRSLGFRNCPAYNDYPQAMASMIVFLEKPLV